MMMNNSPMLWQEFLTYMPKGSLLAGGAVVDFVFGHLAKDFDIFVNKNAVMAELPGNWKYVPPVDMVAHLAEYDIEAKDGTNPILAVEDFDVDFGGTIYRVQRITLDCDPIDHIKSFDHSLTLGVFGPSGLKVSGRVFKSMQTKTVELLNNKRPEKSMLRAQRKIIKLDPEGQNMWAFKGW
jgi:hypothetical protein